MLFQSYLTLSNPMDCSLPCPFVHGIFKARILEWVAISSSRGTSQCRDWSCISRIGRHSLPLNHLGSPCVIFTDNVIFTVNSPCGMHIILCCVVFSCVWFFVTPRTVACRVICLWEFSGKNTGVGCHFLFQGICPTQGSNPYLLNCRQILYLWATRKAPKVHLIPS